MTDNLRSLTDTEIDSVGGGFFLLAAALSACIEYTLHPTDSGGKSDTGDTGDTGNDTGAETEE